MPATPPGEVLEPAMKQQELPRPLARPLVRGEAPLRRVIIAHELAHPPPHRIGAHILGIELQGGVQVLNGALIVADGRIRQGSLHKHLLIIRFAADREIEVFNRIAVPGQGGSCHAAAFIGFGIVEP